MCDGEYGYRPNHFFGPHRSGPAPNCRGHIRRICYAVCGSLGVCYRCGCSPHRHLAGTCVGEGQSHDSADDTPVDRAEQSGRIDRSQKVERSGRVAKRARPLLFGFLMRAATLPQSSCQSHRLLPKSSAIHAAPRHLSPRVLNAPAVRSRGTKYSVICEHRTDSNSASRRVTARGCARDYSPRNRHQHLAPAGRRGRDRTHPSAGCGESHS